MTKSSTGSLSLAFGGGAGKNVEAHVRFYVNLLQGVLVKATLQRGWSQREVAAELQLSKSKVNRLASRPSTVLVNVDDR